MRHETPVDNDGKPMVWSIMDNQWVTRDYWNLINTRRCCDVETHRDDNVTQ